ncbi:NYN domain-containing protein [Spirillospora sp. NBC_01491]|uniref:NYN domain-containing protein n=1 Tax=Spirillospora sp. NBC_01491 TaxID=2976007 RepID=UPI002E352598|nr:NYN domain-containing protein [Spirillospora sp. NBC_01491]
MDRCALFVDAGYLLSDGAMAVHGTRHRETVSWDFGGMLQLLGNLARERTGMPLLRCYWYEATVEGRRSPEHEALADLPGLKLRLGRVRPGRREGVDTDIHRDLMTLARNGALADAVVVSGDEDLSQVVVDAQDLGVRVTVVHVAVDGNWTIARSLRQECDDLIEIGSSHLRPYVNLLSGVESASSASALVPSPLSNGHGNGSGSAIGQLQAASHNGPPPSSPITPPPATITPSIPSAPPAPISAGTGPDYGSIPEYNPSPDYGAGSGSGSAPKAGAGAGSGADYGSGSDFGSGSDYGSGFGSMGGSGRGSPLATGPSVPPAQPTQPPPQPIAPPAPLHAAPTGAHAAAPPHPPPPPPQSTGPQYIPSPPPQQSTGPQYIPSPPPQQTTGPQYIPSVPAQAAPSPPHGPYTGPQQISPLPVQQSTPTLSDAVKSAHQEGEEFGESVARDAPALWLEAVLARKPRMPSDLEARLLQGSSLPIDFLLHDEVRHALRRGFWDALERSRR